MAKDHYSVLGVPRTAKPDEIQRAYRKLARKYHPDVNHEPDAADKFKEIGEAYDTLSDPETRAGYDRFGADYRQYAGSGAGRGAAADAGVPAARGPAPGRDRARDAAGTATPTSIWEATSIGRICSVAGSGNRHRARPRVRTTKPSYG